MRVITGSARGRRLKELEGQETRPTTDRVKEGMFSILQFDIEGRRVLDLFAGTGQLGIECPVPGRRIGGVRGPADGRREPDPGESARHRTSRTGPGWSRGRPMEYLNSLREHFDLIFLDPPYAAGLLEPALAHIAAV